MRLNNCVVSQFAGPRTLRKYEKTIVTEGGIDGGKRRREGVQEKMCFRLARTQQRSVCLSFPIE